MPPDIEGPRRFNYNSSRPAKSTTALKKLANIFVPICESMAFLNLDVCSEDSRKRCTQSGGRSLKEILVNGGFDGSQW